MSNSVDNRVVSMEFDNAQFERNVAQSLETLKHLDKSLDGLTDSSKKFDGVSFENIANSIDSLASRFTLMGRITQTVFNEIAQGIVNAGKSLASFSLEGIESGWDKYAEKTSAVQTIMSATGREIEYVEEQLGRLNRFSDETSYSFTDMTSNIAKFTSQGIGLDTAVTQMQGIATWAASAGANAQTASRAMYNISQAMGAGSMQLIDWKSIQNAQMATKEFKEQAMAAAVKVGTLRKEGDKFVTSLKGEEVTIENFATTLRDKWFDTDTMSEVFTNYGKFADLVDEVSDSTGLEVSALLSLSEAEAKGARNQKEFNRALKDSKLTAKELEAELAKLNAEEYQFSRKTYEAAQQARTFTDAVNATKDAVGSAWMDVFQAIFGNYEEQRVLWTDMANWLWRIFAAPVRSLQYTLEEVMGGTGKIASVSKSFQEILSGTGMKADDYGGILTTVLKKSGMLTDEMIESAGDADKAILGITGDTDKLKNVIDDMLKSNSSGTKDSIELLEDYRKVAREIWSGDWGNGTERKDALEAAGFDYTTAQYFAEMLHEGVATTEADLWRLGEAASELTEEQKEALTNLKKAIDDGTVSVTELRDVLDFDFSDWTGRELLFGKADDKRGALYNFMDAVDNVRTAISDAWDDMFGKTKVQVIRSFLENLNKVSKKFLDLTSDTGKLTGIFKGFFAAMSIGKKAVTLVTGSIKTLFQELTPSNLGIGDILSNFGELLATFDKWLADNHIVNKAINGLSKGLKNLKKELSPLRDSFSKLFDSFKSVGFLEKVGEWFSQIFSGAGQLGGSVFKSLGGYIGVASAYLSGFVDRASSFVNLNFPAYIAKLDKFFKSLSLENVVDWVGSLKNELSTFVNTISSFIKTGDTTKLLSSLQGQFSGVFTAVSAAYNRVKEFFKAVNVTSVFSTIKDNFSGVLDRIVSSYNSVRELLNDDGISNIFNAAVGKFGNFADNISGIFTALMNAFKTGDISKFFDSLKISFSDIIGRMTEFYNRSKGFFSNLLSSAGTNISTSLLNISPSIERIKDVLNSLREKAETTFNSLIKTFEESKVGRILAPIIRMLGELRAAIQNFFGSISSDKANALMTLASGFMSLIAALKMLKIAKIAGKSFGKLMETISSSVKSATDVVTNIAKTFKDIITGIGNGIKEFSTNIFKSVNSIIKVYKNKARVNNILKIAAAIAILAGALALLAYIPEDRIQRAGLALAQIAGVLGLVSLVIAGAARLAGASGMAQASVALLSFSAAVLILIGALKLLESIDVDTFGENFVKLAALMLTLSASLAIIGFASRGGNISGMLGFALGVLALVFALRQIQDNLKDLSLRSFVILSGICLLLAGLSWITHGVKLGSALGLVLIAASLLIIQNALRKAMADAIPEKEFDSYWSSFINMVGMLIALSLLSRVTGGVFKALGLVVLAEALILIQNAIKKAMANAIPVNEFTKYWASFLEILVLLGAMFLTARLAGKGALKAAALMLAFVVVLKLTSTLMKQLGKIDEGELKQGLLTIEAIGLLYVAMLAAVAAIGHAKKSPVASIALVLLSLIGVFAALIYFTTIPLEQLLPAIVAAAVVLGGLAAVFFAVASIGKGNINLQAIGAMAAAIVGIGLVFAALIYATQYVSDSKTLIATCAAFAIVALALAASLRIIQNNKSTWESAISTGILVVMAAVSMIPIAFALKQIGDMDPLSLIGAAAAIGIVALALAASLKIIQNNKSTWESAISTGILVVMAAASAILIAMALQKLDGMNWANLLAGAVAIGIVFLALSASISKLSNANLSNKEGIISAAVGLGLALAAILVVFGVLAIVGAACKDVDSSANALSHGAEMIGYAIGTFVGSIAEGMFAHASGIADSLVEFIDKIIPAIEKIGAIPDDTQEKVGKLMDAMKALADAELRNAFANLINGLLGEVSDASLADKFTKFGDNMKSLVESLKSLNENDVNKAASITSAVASLLAAMPKEGGKLDWLLGSKSQGMGNLKEGLGTFAEGIKSAASHFAELTDGDVEGFRRASDITSIISSFSIDKAGGLWQKAIGTQSGGLDSMGASLVAFAQKLRSAAIWFSALTSDDKASFERGKEITDVISQINVGKDGGLWQDLAGSDAGGLTAMGDNLVTFGQKLHAAAMEFGGITDEDVSAFDRAKNILDKFGLISSTPTSNATGATAQLPEVASNVAQADSNLQSVDTGSLNSKYDDIVAMVTNLSNIGTEGSSFDLSGLTSCFEKLPEAAENGVTGMINAFNNKTGEAESSGKSFGESFVKAVDSMKSTAEQTASGVAQSGVTGLSSQDGAATSSGSYFGQGFANGIWSRLGDVQAAAAALAEAASSALNMAAQIASPSKITTQSGRFFGRGFAIGMRKETSNVEQSAADMVHVATNAISLASAMIEDILNSDGQPTITPVLDLSEVRKEAQSLGSLGSMTASVSASRAKAISGLRQTIELNGNQNGSSSSTNNSYSNVINVYATPNQSVEDIASAVERRMVLKQKQRTVAFVR